MHRALLASGLLALAGQSSAQDEAAESVTLFLPQATDDLQASIIWEESSATEYFIACATAWDVPQDCEAPFTGATLTASPDGVVDIELDGTFYHCSQGEEEAVCQTRTAQDAPEETLAIAASETADWLATLALVEPTFGVDLDGEEINGARRRPGSGGSGNRTDDDDLAMRNAPQFLTIVGTALGCLIAFTAFL